MNTLIQRTESRFPCSVPAQVEFVRWDETNLRMGWRLQSTQTFDLNSRGAGLLDIGRVDGSLAQKLISGERKVRLSLQLYPDLEPLVVFARLIWAGGEGSKAVFGPRSGCQFLDVDPEFHTMLERYLETVHGRHSFRAAHRR